MKYDYFTVQNLPFDQKLTQDGQLRAIT